MRPAMQKNRRKHKEGHFSFIKPPFRFEKHGNSSNTNPYTFAIVIYVSRAGGLCPTDLS